MHPFFQGAPGAVARPHRWSPARRALRAGLAVAAFWISGRSPAADEETAPPLLEDIHAFYLVPPAQAGVPHRYAWVIDVLYYDPDWNLLWVVNNGLPTFLQPGTKPLPLEAGHRYRAEGELTPAQGISLQDARIAPLAEAVPVAPLATAGHLADAERFSNRLVTVQAVVDQQSEPDANHLMLDATAEGLHVTIRVRLRPSAARPPLTGSVVLATGIYASESNFVGGLKSVAVWVPDLDGLQVRGSLRDDPRFTIPPVPIEEVPSRPPGQCVHVIGTVHSFDNTAALVTLRDATGQIAVITGQTRDIHVGGELHAIGYPELAGVQWRLRQALVLPVKASRLPEEHPAAGARTPLHLADQVLALKPDDADRGLPVEIFGVGTWISADHTAMFVQDVTRGIEVSLPPLDRWPPDLPCAVRVIGRTIRGAFAPRVVATHLTWNNPMGSPAPRVLSLEQLLTGNDHGNWVELQAYLRAVRREARATILDLTTATGEFAGELPPGAAVAATPGAVVDVAGVCAVIANERRQLTGVRLLVPSPAFVTTVRPAPADPFALPLIAIASLREFGPNESALRRVRTSGVVLYQDPGRLLCLQDENEALLVLSRDTEPLTDGDRVEVVGIPGREGGRLVLREAACRRTGPGSEPAPVELARPEVRGEGTDGRLVRITGLVSGIRHYERETRLTVQADSRLFEAALPRAEFDPRRCEPGALVALRGVYRSRYDEYHQPIDFALQLRTAGDIEELRPPPLWTVPRAFGLAAALAALAAAVLTWLAVLRSRVAQQTRQIRRQLEEQRRLEAELLRAERIESLGVLAGGIAHDFNNLLTIIRGNVSLAVTEPRVAAIAGRFLAEAEQGAKRACELTQQLLIFAKGGSPSRAATNLPELVRETVAFSLHGTNVRGEFDFAPDLPNADVDRVQIGQVVQNLTINAVQAMPGGGILRLGLANANVAEGAVTGLKAGRYLLLTVADTGTGIDPKNLPNIFDPYFTTKKKGHGLGLATAYSIVKRHGGHTAVESTPGRGTTFRIWLPAAEAGQQAAPAPSESAHPLPAPPAAAVPRILVMDDEVAIRQLATAALLKAGCEVTAVADGQEAVESFAAAQAHGRPFDLVILDLTVPGGMGGAEANAEIRRLDPRIRTIVSSGYSKDAVLTDLRAHGFDAVIPKPYDIAQLTAVVRRSLAARRGSAPPVTAGV